MFQSYLYPWEFTEFLTFSPNLKGLLMLQEA